MGLCVASMLLVLEWASMLLVLANVSEHLLLAKSLLCAKQLTLLLHLGLTVALRGW